MYNCDETSKSSETSGTSESIKSSETSKSSESSETNESKKSDEDGNSSEKSDETSESKEKRILKSNIEQLKKQLEELTSEESDETSKTKENDDFKSNKYIGTSFRAGKLYNQENMDVNIMGTRFELPKSDGILIPSYLHHAKSKEYLGKNNVGRGYKSLTKKEIEVPLSLLQIKVFYDDGFLDHPDIKTTHDAINYIMATLEHVQHSMCLSTMGTRLQIEVSICKMLPNEC